MLGFSHTNPLVLPYHAAAKCLSFLAWRSKDGSLKATSATSKILIGTLCFLFSLMVFNKPGSRLVRTTWYSAVLGFSSLMAVFPSSTLLSHEKFSSCEQRIKGMTSLQPAIADSIRTISPSLLIGKGWAMVADLLGFTLGSLLKPKAIATCSITVSVCSALNVHRKSKAGSWGVRMSQIEQTLETSRAARKTKSRLLSQSG